MDATESRLSVTGEEETSSNSPFDLDRLELNEKTEVGILPAQKFQVDGQMVASEVEEILRDAPDLAGVVIEREGKVAGFISRRKFYEILGKRYGAGVYLFRPIIAMLEAVNPEPLIVPATQNITGTMRLALDRALDQIYEPILVETRPEEYRMLDVYTLLLAQNKLFESMQTRMTLINQELETRVAARTTELVQVNASLEQEISVRKGTEMQLEIRLDYEQTLAKCANALLTGGDAQGVILETLTYLLNVVGVSRAFIGKNVELRKLGPCLQFSQQVCIPDLTLLPAMSGILPHNTIQGWVDTLWTGGWVMCLSGEMAPFEEVAMDQLGLASLLLVPIGESGDWQGAIGFGEVEKVRRWDESDIQLIQTVAQMLYAYLERRRNAMVLAVARDEALRASNFKTELISKVSHELRTPLGAILGYGQLLNYGSYGSLNDEQKNATDRMIGSTKYLTMLVNGILDQAQLESGNLVLQDMPFRVREMVEEVESRIRVLAETKGLQFEVDIAPDTPDDQYGDNMRLQQVLTNILGNAVKFTDTGFVYMRVAVAEGQLVMEVTDTGPGIPEEMQSQIFEPFSQVDGSPTRMHSGAGLGLSISKQLVDMMDGEIELRSFLDKGSKFAVKIPLRNARERIPGRL